MKKVLVLLITLILLGAICFFTYKHMISAPSNEDLILEFNVEKGSTYNSIAEDLEKEGFIRSALFYKIYLKLNPVEENLEYGRYYLPTKDSVENVIGVLKKGSDTLADTVTVTFIEGKNMRSVISVITKNFNITEKQVLDKLSDKDYLDRLIDKYWFITKDIKKKDIYYSLEGYLYPDTYEFTNEDVTVKEIFEKMLKKMEEVLRPYKEDIEDSDYSIHEMLTLASITEKEALNAEDRAEVAGVFYNRLDRGMGLQSDVTTYYGLKIDDWSSRNLTSAELNKSNGYNTRASSMAGKLPIGPICMVSESAISAAVNPKDTKAIFFVADKNGKVYFSRTNDEHEEIIKELKDKDLWYTYEEE